VLQSVAAAPSAFSVAVCLQSVVECCNSACLCCCSVLQSVLRASGIVLLYQCYSALQCFAHIDVDMVRIATCLARGNTATHCNTLQHTATHCNTLQHTATHCSTLQHTRLPRQMLMHAHLDINVTRINTCLARNETGFPACCWVCVLQRAATQCNYGVAAHCNEMSCTGQGTFYVAVCCVQYVGSGLQHAATCCLAEGNTGRILNGPLPTFGSVEASTQEEHRKLQCEAVRSLQCVAACCNTLPA